VQRKLQTNGEYYPEVVGGEKQGGRAPSAGFASKSLLVELAKRRLRKRVLTISKSKNRLLRGKEPLHAASAKVFKKNDWAEEIYTLQEEGERQESCFVVWGD